MRIVLKDSKIKDIDKLLSGSTAVAIAYDEPVSPAKVINKFNENSDLPTVKGILFEGEYFDGDQFKKFAELPNKEELVSKFAMMINAPMSKFASTINAPIQKLAGAFPGRNLGNLGDYNFRIIFGFGFGHVNA